jgi:hypothetical protein
MKKIILLTVLTILIVGCAGINVNKSAAYMYSNGDSEFKVTKVLFEKYVGYQVEYFYPNNPQPFFINLRYDPESLEDIEIDRTIFHKIKDDETIYITINPFENLTSKTTIAAMEIDKIIDNQYFFNIEVKSSMTEKYANYPIKTCNDATKESSVIWLKLGEETKITSEENCIIVEATTEDDMIRAADRLSLYLIGIMP